MIQFRAIMLIALFIACNTNHSPRANDDWNNRHDLDGDGKPDRITYSFSGGAHCCYNIGIRLSSNGRAYTFPFQLDGGYPAGLNLSRPENFFIKDYDGDGRPEVFMLAYSYNGKLHPIPPFIRKRFGIKHNFIVVDFISGKLAAHDFPRYLSVEQYYLSRRFQSPPGNLRAKRFGDLFGYVDEKGETRILPLLKKAHPFQADTALMQPTKSTGTLFVDSNGRVLAEFASTVHFPENRFAPNGLLPAGLGERFVFVNRRGRIIIDKGLQSARGFVSGLAAVQDSNGKWGYLDSKGRWRIEPRFETAFSFENGRAHVIDKGRYIYIDRKGKELGPLKPSP